MQLDNSAFSIPDIRPFVLPDITGDLVDGIVYYGQLVLAITIVLITGYILAKIIVKTWGWIKYSISKWFG